MNRGSKVVAEVLEMAWEMEGAQETLEGQSKSRIELLEESRVGECVNSCNGQWPKVKVVHAKCCSVME